MLAQRALPVRKVNPARKELPDQWVRWVRQVLQVHRVLRAFRVRPVRRARKGLQVAAFSPL
jgi:hypothetical protein